MIVAEITITPIGVGTSMSGYIKAALDALSEEGVKFEVNAMGTVVETEDIGTLFRVVERVHEAVFKEGAERAVTMVKIDDRRDKGISIKSKVNALKR